MPRRCCHSRGRPPKRPKTTVCHPQGLATRPITVRPWDAGTADGSEARAGAALGRLPRASTCTRELWLPQYSSAEMLEQRLAAAVESLDAEAFHLV